MGQQLNVMEITERCDEFLWLGKCIKPEQQKRPLTGNDLHHNPLFSTTSETSFCFAE
jgi:hypothetical protein